MVQEEPRRADVYIEEFNALGGSAGTIDPVERAYDELISVAIAPKTERGWPACWIHKDDDGVAGIRIAYIGPERGLQESTVVVPPLAGRYPQHHAMTPVGEGFALSWSWPVVGGTDQMYTRLDGDFGTQVPIQQVAARGFGYPSMAWTGQELLVAGYVNLGEGSEVYLDRWDAGGVPLAERIQVTDGPLHNGKPKLIWTGRHVGLAWSSSHQRIEGSASTFMLLDARGQPLGEPLAMNLEGSDRSHSADLIWTGQRFGVLFQAIGNEGASRRPVFQWISAEGRAEGPPILIGRPRGWPLRVLWTGRRVLVLGIGQLDGRPLRMAVLDPGCDVE